MNPPPCAAYRPAARSRRSLLGATLAAAALSLAGHGGRAAGRTLVLAAVSLKDVMEALGREFTRATGTSVRFAFAATSTLVRQLEQGIEADVFIGADQAWMDYAAQRRLVDPRSVVELIGNRLVLVAPQGALAAFELRPGIDLRARLDGGRLAVADVRSVPAGRYAKEALQSLALWGQVSERLAVAENVRAALVLAAHGEVRLAAVYETDARADPRVEVVARFPPQSHRPIRYPAALVSTRPSEEAVAFHHLLGTPAAARVFRAHGFTVPG